ncbi:hypothetical protein Aca07nite_59380 [Actinoplanes capillaceus]|uniref:Uncharacterized protein n=1 Tax=Actinoplanes campanulatus TaxID=113559 RepID=A0ABQ3WR49_9ACTN|nr:hypothetical protein Aca07nite_59380 [Actinoplanes capillaceus]
MGSENRPVDQRADFEAKLTDLRGRCLTAVDYWGVHNFSPEPAEWDYGDWHHAVMGAQLNTDRGPVTVTRTAAPVLGSSRTRRDHRSATTRAPVAATVVALDRIHNGRDQRTSTG